MRNGGGRCIVASVEIFGTLEVCMRVVEGGNGGLWELWAFAHDHEEVQLLRAPV